MQLLTAIIDGQTAQVITPLSREECRESCLGRFGSRFEGFEDDKDGKEATSSKGPDKAPGAPVY